MSWVPWRKKKTDPNTPLPQPAPDAPVVSVPEIRPSNIQIINYVRALLILKNIPFTKLRDELKKLPWLHIFYVLGVLIWLVMSVVFIRQLLLAVAS